MISIEQLEQINRDRARKQRMTGDDIPPLTLQQARADRLKEIQNRCTQASSGYEAITCHVYAKDVNSLLNEREELLKQIQQMADQMAVIEADRDKILTENEPLSEK